MSTHIKPILVLIITIALFIAFITIARKIFNQPVMIIVPHQNVPNSYRADLLSKASQDRLSTKKIIILSPDHFSFTGKGIRYTSKDWNIEQGTVQFGGDILSTRFLDRMANDPAVMQDHGISNLIPDIYKNFPNAKIIPIVVGMDLGFDQLGTLITELYTQCKYDCLIIGSVDFSHYLPYSIANMHDRFATTILEANQIERASDLEVDSQQVLYVLMKIAQLQKVNFNKVARSNSAEISGGPKAESTGHVFGYYSYNNVKSSDVIDSFIVSKATNDTELEIFPRYFYGVNNKYLGLDHELSINNIKIIPVENDRFDLFCSDDNRELKILLGVDVLLTIEKRNNRSYIYPTFKNNGQRKIEPQPCFSYDPKLSEIVVD